MRRQPPLPDLLSVRVQAAGAPAVPPLRGADVPAGVRATTGRRPRGQGLLPTIGQCATAGPGAAPDQSESQQLQAAAPRRLERRAHRAEGDPSRRPDRVGRAAPDCLPEEEQDAGFHLQVSAGAAAVGEERPRAELPLWRRAAARESWQR